jgi:hypothetical protein
LLVREVLLAEDGIDYVPGTRGYRALSPVFIARSIRRAKAGGWVHLAAHCHGGSGHVEFSSVDLESHERGYPALRQLSGGAVGGLVFADNAAAGDLWTVGGARSQLNSVRVVGDNITEIGGAVGEPNAVRDAFDRQARLLGTVGQDRLERLRVAVVGLGGSGSMAAQMLVRLGVGDLVFIVPDRIDPTNLSRIVGSAVGDTDLRESRSLLSWLGRARRGDARMKVEIAADQAKRSGLRPAVEIYPCDISEPDALRSIRDCDWIVLAADSQTARHAVNAIAHAYLIPVIQVGVKIPVDESAGTVGEIFSVARHITTDAGCLWCNGLIDATELQLEAIGDNGVRARAYVGPDAPAPSVITLNGTAVGMGMTQLLLSTAGLITPTRGRPGVGYQRLLPRSHQFRLDEPRRDPDCIHCSQAEGSLLARGDAATLPTRHGASDPRIIRTRPQLGHLPQ